MMTHLPYNPGLLDREALIAQFVARERELARALEDVRAGRPGHHVLLAGTRGMGKTTLLHRIAAEVASDARLSGWLALTFPEEQYNVRTVADFWVNCLDSLADLLERSNLASAALALDADIAGLPADDGARETDALALLERYAAGRHLLLLVDNLDLLAERIDGWQLRQTLSDPQRDLTIVGATSGEALFTADYGKPFLDFFTVVPLDPLTFAEAKDLLRTLARRDAAEGLLALLDQDEGRFYGLFTLSGGNPRTLTQLYTVLSRPDARDRDIEADLEQLLDQVTPLYKARFEQLPTQAQQVLDAVAIHWAPAQASAVATALRMEVTQVSAQLSRLEKLGWVEKVALADTSRSAFQVAERFFNVWYLVRTSRRMRKKLMLLAECLVALHDRAAVRAHAARALSDRASGDAPTPLFVAEFADLPWGANLETKGAVALLHRLDEDERSLAEYDSFFASTLPRPVADYVVSLVVASVLRGDPVPVRLVEAIAEQPGRAGWAALLLFLDGQWDRAAELARQPGAADRVADDVAADLFDRALLRGDAARLATFLAATPFGDRLMPYAAASAALAKADPRQLLAWPAEVRQAARELVDRFATTAAPASKPATRRGRRAR